MSRRMLPVVLALLAGASPAAAKEISYVKDIQPLLKNYCMDCHNSATPKAGINLETYQSSMKPGKVGVPIVPGQPEKSPLVQAMLGNGYKTMPPRKYSKQPTREEIALVRAWVAAGAKNDTAETPPQPEPPKTEEKTPRTEKPQAEKGDKESGERGEKEGREKEKGEKGKGRRERQERDDD